MSFAPGAMSITKLSSPADYHPEGITLTALIVARRLLESVLGPVASFDGRVYPANSVGARLVGAHVDALLGLPDPLTAEPDDGVSWGQDDTRLRQMRPSRGSVLTPDHTDGVEIEALREDMVDLLLIARPALENPHWPLLAALTLGRDAPYGLVPTQYHHALLRSRDLVDCGGFGVIGRRADAVPA